MTRRKPETEAQRQARVERYNAYAMRQYANMDRKTTEALSTELGRAIAERNVAYVWGETERIPALEAEVERLRGEDHAISESN